MLCASFHQQHGRHGFDQDEDIAPDGLAFDVADIQTHLLGEFDGVAVADFEEAAFPFADLP